MWARRLGEGKWRNAHDKCRALALRRDLAALSSIRPARGWPEGLPEELCWGIQFEKDLACSIVKVDKEMQHRAGSLPFNAIYGPWEGGMAGGRFAICIVVLFIYRMTARHAGGSARRAKVEV